MSAYVASMFWAAMAAITLAAFVDMGDPVFAGLATFFALVSQIVSRDPA